MFNVAHYACMLTEVYKRNLTIIGSIIFWAITSLTFLRQSSPPQ